MWLIVDFFSLIFQESTLASVKPGEGKTIVGGWWLPKKNFKYVKEDDSEDVERWHITIKTRIGSEFEKNQEGLRLDITKYSVMYLKHNFMLF